MAGKLKGLLDDEFADVEVKVVEDKPVEKPVKESKPVKPEPKEEKPVVVQEPVEEDEIEDVEEEEIEVEEKPAKKAAPSFEKSAAKKRGAKRKMDADQKADFLQIDIRGMRDYLSTITSYESMKAGDKISFNTYIRGLIEKDMKKNASTYESFKKLFEQ